MAGEISTIISRLPGNRALVSKRSLLHNERLNPSGNRLLEELKSRDRDVRQHEANHGAAPGVVTVGSPVFSYQVGPDGKPYAIGGKVTLSTIPTADPRVAERRAATLKDAALANGDPSPQDLAAASSASQMQNEAQLQQSRSVALYYRNMQNELDKSEYPQNPSFNHFA